MTFSSIIELYKKGLRYFSNPFYFFFASASSAFMVVKSSMTWIDAVGYPMILIFFAQNPLNLYTFDNGRGSGKGW